jgi:D-glycero-alpha-D-manno-heptose 1-phosphate guanylyltransferase
MMPEEAIVLAGGFGTRLRAVVRDVPKPLAPIAGRPFLAWLLESLARSGLRRAVLATGHLAEQVEQAFGTRFAGLDIAYSREDTPLGTGGATWQALRLTRGERVLVLNGDTWFGIDHQVLAAAAPAADVAMALRPVPDRARYGSVELADGRVTRFLEKGATGPGLINAGVYVLRRDLVARLPRDGGFALEREVLEVGEETRYLYRVEAVVDRAELSFSRAEQGQYRLPQSLRSQQEKVELQGLPETAAEEVLDRPFPWAEMLWPMLREEVEEVEETVEREETEVGTLEEERVEQVGRRVRTPTAEEEVEVEAREP